jgi:hypothetical protein
MNKKYPTFFLTWFNKFSRVPYPGKLYMWRRLCCMNLATACSKSIHMQEEGRLPNGPLWPGHG